LIHLPVDGIIDGIMNTHNKNTVKLTDKFIRDIKPAEKPQKFADSLGLYLYVSPTGTKSWRYDYRLHSKRATLTIGKFPEINLSAARSLLHENRLRLSGGANPSLEKKNQKLELKNQHLNTFEDLSDSWYQSTVERRSKAWQDANSLYLRRDLLPKIGTHPIAEITPGILLSALEATRKRSGAGTADRVRQTAVQIFDYAKRRLKVTENVARSLIGWSDNTRPQKKHRAWIKSNELPQFLDAVDAYPGYLTTQYAAKLLLLTFVRKTELIDAEWSEFDFSSNVWTIPASRMKMPTEDKSNRHNGHEVFLSKQAIELLHKLKPICSGSKYLFPGNSSLDKPMGKSTLNVMFERMGYAGVFTPHGMRGTASTILNERGFRADVIERQLAHVERSTVRRAYNHAEYKEERRAMLQAWADYLDEIRLQTN